MPSPLRLSPRRVLLLLLPALCIFWLWNTRYPPVREYKLYLTDTRRVATLDWSAVSEQWTESALRSHFSEYPTRCMPDETGVPGVTRMCVVDFKSLNGVPTMTANFLFKGDSLSRVATSIPWWSHRAGLDELLSRYGEPLVSQEVPVSGVRLHGWGLANGASVFYNRDPVRNPLDTNSVQWLGPSACAPAKCIH